MAYFKINNRSLDGTTYFSQQSMFNWTYASVVEMVSNSLTPDYFTIQLSSVPGFGTLYARFYGNFNFYTNITSGGTGTYIQAGSVINNFEIIDVNGKVYNSFSGLNLPTNKDMTTIYIEPVNVFATSFRPGEVPLVADAFYGNDTLDGNNGTELLYGYAGNDTINGFAGIDALYGGYGDDRLTGGADPDDLYGEDGNDTIAGYTSGDYIDGGANFDTWELTGTYTTGISIPPKIDMRGVSTYNMEAIKVIYGDFVFNPNQVGGSSTVQTIIGGSQYRDALTVRASDTGSLTGTTINLSTVNFQNWNNTSGELDLVTVEGTAGGDTIDGGSVNEAIYAYNGNNLVRGNGGNDNIIALDGNDTLRGGDGNDSLTGYGGNDILIGDNDGAAYPSATIGNDTLDGGAGSDTLAGLAGDNVIKGGDGIDTVDYGFTVSAADHGYPTNFYINLSVVVDPATPGVYNAGGSYQDPYDGSSVNIFRDQLVSIENVDGSDYADDITGNALGNRLYGWGSNDVIAGGDGNDTIDGGTGSDAMAGGAGNDIFTIDNLGDGGYYEDGDSVTELSGGGVDTIRSSVSYSLADTDLWGANGGNVENLTLTGTGNLNATGNALNNVLIGNAGVNTLLGQGGNDTLNGAAGADAMTGGDGSDVYYVDNAGDVVSETNATLSTGGTDLVNSYLAAYTLGDNVENGRILNTGAASITGNSLNNLLYAGAGNNTLNGGSGIDTGSYANAGSAVTVSLAVATAQATGGSGSDTLTAVENLTGSNYNDSLTGNTGNNVLNGGSGNDTLSAGAGNDALYGGLGNDLLTGGAGIDSFIFNTTLNAGTNKDTISDFVSGTDKIKLDDAVCSAIGTLGNFVAGDVRFYAAAGAVAGHDLDDRVIYNTTTGALYYDADGSGAVAAIQIALLGASTHPGLAATDCMVI